MSNISQFMASAGVEIGQQLNMPGALNNFTIGTKEYLRCGFLKSYTSAYSTFKTRVPFGGFVDVTPLSKSASLTGSVNFGVYHNGTRYLVVSNIQNANTSSSIQSTDGITWTAANFLGSTQTASYGSCKIGSNVVCTFSDGTQVPIQYTSNFTSWNYAASGISAGAGVQSIAANTAGTLAVAIIGNATNTAASNIYTSTDGSAWTARTGTGGQAITIMKGVHWSPCSSAFLIVGTTSNNNVLINKTTDGYTQTTSLTDANNLLTSTMNEAAQLYMASSSSVTLISCQYGILKRTTDGSTWTTVNLATQSGISAASVGSTQPPYIWYDSVTNKFYAYINNISLLGISNGLSNMFVSSDGITWTQSFVFRDASTTFPAVGLVGQYGVYSANSKAINLALISGSVKGIFDNATALNKTSPDWVGMIAPTDTTTYVRIL